MRPNTALRKWRAGEQTVGGWLTIDSSFAAETMAHAGFDWLCVDLQHGQADYDALQAILQGISTTQTVPLVRVPWNMPGPIMKALDLGAYGVIVPMVNSRAEAEAAVAACRYPPAGIRSAAGGTRAVMYGGADYLARADEEIACCVMIETAAALDELDAILSTPGVDAAYIGPMDLAQGLGLPAAGDQTHPRHVAAVDRIREACRRHGVAAGIHTGSVAFARRYLDQGFQMVTLGSDSGWMYRGATADLAAVLGRDVAPDLGEA